ncbi:AfsR/SARP family transcriptional regulator [Nonomuraea endophytica]|uniref:DNA-binding SARP family transcriptional activator/tetratricopeptide (TPR) repeat protein n=1 Tax=Nonomuraea endophytica TaxID=714136 RepID=A0A7W8ABG3_9ACTN|nr:BTAD domain-containing putative transcriptional regulator [Nonomuraea endophytica]MBB5082130.1 DNA-binding SARP family transcriptional activator/tetratricopeptide (TPR) repeat protein [Nonomuraea endophytica]
MALSGEPGTRFGILGPLEVAVGDRPVHVGGPRPQAVLATLLLHSGQTVSTGRLVDLVWEDAPPSSVRGQVAAAISALRGALRKAGGDPALIETVAGGYRVPRTLALDALTVEQGLAAARQEAAGGRTGQAAATFRAMLKLWRGPVLGGITSSALLNAASRWEELRLTALEECVELELDLGHHRELTAELRTFVGEHPLRERARAQLMLSLSRSGRQADALAVYDEGRRLMVDELGLEPGPRLREVHNMILLEDPVTREPEREVADVRPAQLPPAAFAFTGRQAELEELDSLLETGDETGGETGDAVRVSVVSGVGGIGKTALAMAWAHRRAERFPDGQLFADLSGFTRGSPPAAPESVLDGFLRALGVPGRRIPQSLAERTALYRSMLVGRRLLVVLDNAHSADQVRPLLPGSGTCRVIVTSRKRLSGLVVQEGARPLALEVLQPADARLLLRRIAGRRRVEDDGDELSTLAELCDRLPLALRIAAAKLAVGSAWSLGELTGSLRAERHRLNELRQDEEQLRNTFELSYLDLPQPARRAFRRIGLLQGVRDLAPWTLAALLHTSLRGAEELCEELANAQMLQPARRDASGQRRYTMHDLVRLFAIERAEAEESQEQRAEALTRAIGGMLALAERARGHDHPRHDLMLLRGTAPRHPAEPPPQLDADPMTWLDAERHTLMAFVTQAARLGWAGLAWELAATPVYLYEMSCYFDDWRTVADAALSACRESGDRRGEAAMLLSLGEILHQRRQLPESQATLATAMRIFEEVGDEYGAALARRYRGVAFLYQGAEDAALKEFRAAFAVFERVGDSTAEAVTLGNIALLHTTAGCLELAEEPLVRALALPLGKRTQALLTKRLADTYHALGRNLEAVEAGRLALRLTREQRDQIGEVWVLLSLGEALSDLDGRLGRETLVSSLAGADRLGDLLLSGRAHLALARLGGEDADDHLDLAITAFRSLGAQHWLEKALHLK